MAGREHIFGQHRSARAPTAPAAGVPCDRGPGGRHRVASLGYGITENSQECAQSVGGLVRAVRRATSAPRRCTSTTTSTYGLPNGIAPEVTAMKEAGVDFISTCIDLNGMKTLAQELDRQGMDDVDPLPPQHLQPAVRGGERRPVRGRLRHRAVPAVRGRRRGDGRSTTFHEWMDETGGELTELAMVGWINADLAFQGLLAAGPEFDRAVGGRRHQPDDRLRRRRADQPHRLDPPARPPHRGRPPARLRAGVRRRWCRSSTARSRRSRRPDKPWLCWSNDDQDWSEPDATTSFDVTLADTRPAGDRESGS